ncbi:hypothetical protein ADT28_02270 [Xylella fastidiosa]|nr:hypothetical protein ADT28_02270 [Xylella fastidiosa]
MWVQQTRACVIGSGAAASERKGMLCGTEGAVECVGAGVGMDGVVAQGLAHGTQALRFWEWDEGVVHVGFPPPQVSTRTLFSCSHAVMAFNGSGVTV